MAPNFLSNMFTAKPAVTPPAADPAAAAGNTGVPGNQAQSDGNGPAAFPAAGQGDQSPLANFADLFKPDASAKKSGELPNYTPDPVKLEAATKDINFLQGLDPGLIQKATSGDVTALAAIINHTGRETVKMMTNVNAGIVQNAMTDMHKLYREDIIPGVLRDNNVSQQFANDPLFSNPATAPILEGIKTQMLAKYPTARPDEILQMSQTYLRGFAGEIAKGQGFTMSETPVPGKNGVRTEQDWSLLLG